MKLNSGITKDTYTVLRMRERAKAINRRNLESRPRTLKQLCEQERIRHFNTGGRE